MDNSTINDVFLDFIQNLEKSTSDLRKAILEEVNPPAPTEKSDDTITIESLNRSVMELHSLVGQLADGTRKSKEAQQNLINGLFAEFNTFKESTLNELELLKRHKTAISDRVETLEEDRNENITFKHNLRRTLAGIEQRKGKQDEFRDNTLNDINEIYEAIKSIQDNHTSLQGMCDVMDNRLGMLEIKKAKDV